MLDELVRDLVSANDLGFYDKAQSAYVLIHGSVAVRIYAQQKHVLFDSTVYQFTNELKHLASKSLFYSLMENINVMAEAAGVRASYDAFGHFVVLQQAVELKELRNTGLDRALNQFLQVLEQAFLLLKANSLKWR